MNTDTTFELLLCIPPGEYDVRLADFAEDNGLKAQSALSYAQKAIRLGFGIKITGLGTEKRVYAPSATYDKIKAHAERYWKECYDGQDKLEPVRQPRRKARRQDGPDPAGPGPGGAEAGD